MKYVLRLTDSAGEHLVTMTLPEVAIKQPAVDVIFDFVGIEDPEKLVSDNIIPAGQVEDLKALQRIIFTQDDTGLLIKEKITFVRDNSELDPEMPLEQAFKNADLDGMKYCRCDLVIKDLSQNDGTGRKIGELDKFAQVFFLHQIACGFMLDVTKDYPELEETLAWAEKEELVEIDVSKAAYRLTERGKRQHASYISEAQELIKKFDIYADVDLDTSSGKAPEGGEVLEGGKAPAGVKAHFDTGLGKDIRVPILEIEGVDPFRARFLIGLSDGEWDNLDNWTMLYCSPSWYQEIFAVVERAPSVNDFGKPLLLSIIDQAKAILRNDSQFR